MLGTVDRFFDSKGYGFLVDEMGEHRFFHVTNVVGRKRLKRGDVVAFTPYRASAHRLECTDLRPVVQPETGLLLDAISEWKLEAKLEDTSRYFYHTDDVDLIESGSRCYVVGRKGTGKTAIGEYIINKAEPTRFGRKLTFKNFPFNDLYSLSNDHYTPPNQYITLWKYLIYSTLAEMMIRNNNIDRTLRETLSKLYDQDPSGTLQQRVSKWTAAGLEVKFLGTGGSVSLKRTHDRSDAPWIKRVAILEDIMLGGLDDSRYFIVFDELDEDYKNLAVEGARGRYCALITSLYKAVQDVKSIFRPPRYNVLPVIFLRADIFDTIWDSDKTKWSDLTVELDWSADKIKNLLAFRISRALGEASPILRFDEAWAKLFRPEPVQYSTHRTISTFSFISRHTLMRPRDFVRYLKDCAEYAKLRRVHLVGPDLVKTVDKSFSAYLRSEFEDEIQELIPDIRQILDLVASLQKETFRKGDFARCFQSAVQSGKVVERDVNCVLDALFRFSAIGYLTPQGKVVFRHSEKDAILGSASLFQVHRGLYESLQLA